MSAARSTQPQVVVFEIGSRRLGVLAEDVVEVLPAIAIAQLPDSPRIVQGYARVRGEIVPIIDFRERFGLESKPLSVTDHLLLVRVAESVAGFFVDRVDGVAPVKIESPRVSGLAQPSRVAGVAELPDGLVLIHDPATFLTALESEQVATATEALAEKWSRERAD